MKVLLINPPFNIGKANYDDSVSVGLLSIATYLNSKGISVRIIDGVRQKDFLNLVKKEIIGCFCAGISVMTTQIPNALEVSRLIKEVHPQCQIVWGGTHPTFFPRETAIHPLIDIVCFGEGEETLFEIVSSKDHSQIKGIAYKRDDHIIKNPPRKLGDPAKMPLFNWDLVPEEVLHHLRLIPSLTSRGCPHRCAFCINAILKNKWRPRTAQQVLQDLKIIKENKYFWGKKIRFWDENFFVDIGRAKQIINDMITNNLIIPWETTVRVDYIRDGMIDEFFMENLKKSGCYLLSFGAESGSPRILENIQKGITPEQILYSAEICLKHDIIPQYSFMIGLPGDTREDIVLTVSLIDKLARLSDKVQILGPQPFRPYPGSILYEECL